jgi:hypothetical protein
MTAKKRVELYRRLPEIYRIKDEELPKLYLDNSEPMPAKQLLKYLAPVEDMFSAIHENIESLYHDLFIETCDPWVIPYIADLLGTTHISGDEWTRRADVADTIALRRRKGTLGAIELLTYILTKWGAHSVELLEDLVWNQHLNHQRPDEGGSPPYSLPTVGPAAPRRGGTVSLRDPSLLSQLNTPFDPFAHVVDVKLAGVGQVRYNLPNLAIYLWRLKDYRLEAIKPLIQTISPASHPLETPQHQQAGRIVRINIDPVPPNDLSNDYVKPGNAPSGRPVTLFNTSRLDLFARKSVKDSGVEDVSALRPRISTADHVPGPIPVERISDYSIVEAYDDSLNSDNPQPLKVFTDASFTAPQEYLTVETYDPGFTGTKPDPIEPDDPNLLEISDVGLQLHIPSDVFAFRHWPHLDLPRNWTIRGENLLAWEKGVNPPVGDKEIVVDPANGRIAIGVTSEAQANSLNDALLVTFTYGSVGPVGAHPISHAPLTKDLQDVAVVKVSSGVISAGLQAVLKNALKDVHTTVTAGDMPPKAIIIEIEDSRTYRLDTALFATGTVNNEVGKSLLIHCPLIIRAADNCRPIVELVRPLAFRPAVMTGPKASEQETLFVRLEGLYLAREKGFASGEPLIARAAIGRLEIINCTLDPGGFKRYICGPPDINRAPLLPAISVKEPYGFSASADETAFDQIPEIVIQRSICGSVFTDEGYRLCIEDSIVESIPIKIGSTTYNFAIAGSTDPQQGFAGTTLIQNVTILGRVVVNNITGSGGIFTGGVEAFDQQSGCLKYCYFADDTVAGALKNKIPPHFACVFGNEARLLFTSLYFGNQAYCQLSLECDRRILEEGVGNDQMGAFNFLQEAHKWRNLQIRFREFIPVGIKPLLIPVT